MLAGKQPGLKVHTSLSKTDKLGNSNYIIEIYVLRQVYSQNIKDPFLRPLTEVNSLMLLKSSLLKILPGESLSSG